MLSAEPKQTTHANQSKQLERITAAYYAVFEQGEVTKTKKYLLQPAERRISQNDVASASSQNNIEELHNQWVVRKARKQIERNIPGNRMPFILQMLLNFEKSSAISS